MNNCIEILVDHKKIHIDKTNISGEELKKLSNIPLNANLFLKINNGADKIVNNQDIIPLHEKMKFFSSVYNQHIKIHIDRKKYEVPKKEITGLELKSLAGIPQGDKLVKEEKNGPDVEIEDSQVCIIEENNEFFSIPSGIQNGGQA